jgi:hypothetical protein
VRTEVGLERAGFQVKNEVQDGQGSRLELKVRKDMDAVVWANGQQGLVFRRLLRACQEGQGFMLEMKARKNRDAEIRAEVKQGQSFRSLLRAWRVLTYMVSA